MEKTLKIIAFACVSLTVSFLYGQNNSSELPVDGESLIPKNNAQYPCITNAQYALLDKEVQDNLNRLHLETTTNRNTLITSFIWPIRNAAGFYQCDYHSVNAYVDQNTAASSIADFYCGTNTYDGHRGTDIGTWPYAFYKMDNNQIEVVAAAPGFIIQKADGNFDRNCAVNALPANSIIIVHPDSSQALYWHMKENSITSKVVGDWVEAGEYLGVVGSSGSSSGPHLHFEVRSGSTSSSYKDPFSGNCNTLNANSWWITQKPYNDPTIMRVSVNTSDMVFATCPNSDVPTESDIFQVPFQGPGLAPGYAKFYLFMRQIPVNGLLSMRILNPNGTVFNSWNVNMPTYYNISYWGFSKILPTIDGLYTFEASYNGVTCSKTFTITHSLGISGASDADDFRVFPNPTNNDFLVMAEGIDNDDYTFYVSDILGQIITTEKISVENNKLEKSFSLGSLANGIYFLTLDNTNSRVVKKIIKK